MKRKTPQREKRVPTKPDVAGTAGRALHKKVPKLKKVKPGRGNR
jgi:hypothetical protein